MGGWAERLARAHALREQTRAVRRRRVVQARDGQRVQVEGRWLWDFCSNDTLGLASESLPARPALGFGSRASALVSGHHAEHAAFEAEAAAWLGVQRTLYVGSGYQANLLALQALLSDGDLCVQDKLNHACLIDGARFSGATLKRYPHADIGGARRQLGSDCSGLRLLATDAVFSMDGDLAPLRELAVVAARRDALLMVDEAHSIGVLGVEGRGLCDALGLGNVAGLLRSLPLGKAFGASGALLAGSEALIEHLLQWGRPYVYSTAPPPLLAAGLREQLARLRAADDRRAALQTVIATFCSAASTLPLLPSTTAIQPVMLGGNERTLAVAAALEARGYWVAAIRPPTVPEGRGRLRISLSAAHPPEVVEALVQALREVLAEGAE